MVGGGGFTALGRSGYLDLDHTRTVRSSCGLYRRDFVKEPSACYERHMSRRNTDPSHSVCLVDERNIGRVLSAVPANYWLLFNSEHGNRVACLFTYKPAPNVYTTRCVLQMTLSEVIGCGPDGRGYVPERGGFSSYLTPSDWLRSCLLLTSAKQQEREANPCYRMCGAQLHTSIHYDVSRDTALLCGLYRYIGLMSAVQ